MGLLFLSAIFIWGQSCMLCVTLSLHKVAEKLCSYMIATFEVALCMRLAF